MQNTSCKAVLRHQRGAVPSGSTEYGQNTGLFESGDSVRGMWIDLKLPIMALIGYRGYEGGGPSADSAATFLEPILNAWGIPFEIVENDQQVEDVVPRMYQQAKDRPGPAAVLRRPA